MTVTINGVTVSSIENINLNNSISIEELDLVEENTNFIFGGSEQAQEIEVEANLVKQLHPQSYSVEKQREEIKTLVEKDESLNTSLFDNKSGYFVVDNVNIPESSENDTIREVTISGKFLPYPKNLSRFVETDPIYIEGETFSFLDFFSTTDYGVDYSSNYSGGIESNDPQISIERGIESSISINSSFSGSLEFEIPSGYSSNYGSNYSSPSNSVSYGSDYGNDYGIE